MSPKELWALTKESASAWVDDYASSMGAALAYYSLFSIAPMLVVVIAIAGYFFGAEAVRGEIVRQVDDLIGVDGGRALQSDCKTGEQWTVNSERWL